MKRIFFLFIMILLTTEFVYCQDVPSLSRYKISGGLYSAKNEKIENPSFINLNRRFTELDKYSNFDFGMFFESGVNIPYFILYGKGGPELRVFNNFILSANVGIGGFYFFYPFLFYGANSFILIPLSENFYLELEGGFHSPAGNPELQLFYFNFGLSFN